MADRWVNVEAIGSYFESLEDPRHTRNRKHLLVDIVVIAVCGMVCGCDGPTAVHRWAAERHDWLRQFLTLPNGIPSRDCIRRLLMALQPEAFQKCFQGWIAQAVRADEGGPARLVAIDGKTCR
jgi:DDE_Tnp_1-associated